MSPVSLAAMEYVSPLASVSVPTPQATVSESVALKVEVMTQPVAPGGASIVS